MITHSSIGAMMIAVGSDSQFVKLCSVLGRTDIASGGAYATNASRVRNRDALIPVLRQEVLSWERGELLARLARSIATGGRVI
jgi:crotonobetainyl-CoA:carnitine CoA-transferase CaiB-like acyl-CoA transferase